MKQWIAFLRSRPALPFVILFLILLYPDRARPQITEPGNPVLEFTNGRWFDGNVFREKTVYVVNGLISFHSARHFDRVIDLSGGFVVPPFGEAHNHNVEPNKIDALIERYLQHGIFYIKNPNNLPNGRNQVLSKINRSNSIDVTFSNGGFTGIGGHPAEIVQRNIARGIWTESDGDGAFYYAVNSRAEVQEKWVQFLATKPDFVKTYLLYSEEYEQRKDDPKYFGWRGLGPDLLQMIVAKAHASNLRVSTHIESAADFHTALLAGVDEINHMPGFRYRDDVKPHQLSEFEITDSDAKRAAKQGTVVVTTLGGTAKVDPHGKDAALRERWDELNRQNLSVLKRHHVKLALGSDSYREDSVPESAYIDSLHVFDPPSLLNIWCKTTARTIFPLRRVGELREGYEASFLVLSADPLHDFGATQKIRLRVKQGHIIEIHDLPPGSATKSGN